MRYALTKVAELEHAIDNGRLEDAMQLLRDLKPHLVSRNVDELMAMKTRIDQLTISASTQRDRCKAGLENLGRNRRSLASYEQIQSVK